MNMVAKLTAEIEEERIRKQLEKMIQQPITNTGLLKESKTAIGLMEDVIAELQARIAELEAALTQERQASWRLRGLALEALKNLDDVAAENGRLRAELAAYKETR